MLYCCFLYFKIYKNNQINKNKFSKKYNNVLKVKKSNVLLQYKF